MRVELSEVYLNYFDTIGHYFDTSPHKSMDWMKEKNRKVKEVLIPEVNITFKHQMELHQNNAALHKEKITVDLQHVDDPHEARMCSTLREELCGTFKVGMFLFRRNLATICEELDFFILSLIVVSVVMVIVGFPSDITEIIKLSEDTPLFLLRDLFVILVGVGGVFTTLWETSEFTTAAVLLQPMAQEIELPNSSLQIEQKQYLLHTQIAFTINGIPITKTIFSTFMQVSFSAFTYYLTWGGTAQPSS